MDTLYTYMIFAVIGILVVGMGVYYISGLVTSTSVSTPALKQANFFVGLTDPADVPSGTTALYVTYSAVQLSVSTNGVTSSILLPGGGTVNVLDLQNQSIVIATANVSNGSLVKQIKINVSSSIITINGVNYTVLIGEGTLTVNLTSSNTANGKNGALFDLIPSITEIQTADKNVFVLTPTVKAVISPGDNFAPEAGGSRSPNGEPPQVGTRLRFNSTSNITQILTGLGTARNVRITSAHIEVNGNYTSLNVTVENNGTSAVELDGLMFDGPKRVFLPTINVSINIPSLQTNGMPFVPVNGTVIFPNGTVVNVGSSFINSYSPPPIMFNFSAPASAIAHNSTSATFRVPAGSSILIIPSIPTPRNSSYPPPGNGSYLPPGNESYPPPGNQTPASANSNNFQTPHFNTEPVPNGTIIIMRFPHQFSPPPSAPTQNETGFSENMPIGRFIFANGTLGFPPMSVTVNPTQAPTLGSQYSNGQSSPEPGQGGNMGPGSGGASSSLNTTLNLPTQLPPGFILNAGATYTFTLSGDITIGPATEVENENGPVRISPPTVELFSGDNYIISLFGKDGNIPSYNVTAT